MACVAAEQDPVPGPTPAANQVNLQLHHRLDFRPPREVIITDSDWTVCTTFNLVTYEEAHASISGQLHRVEQNTHAVERAVDESIAAFLKFCVAMWNPGA